MTFKPAKGFYLILLICITLGNQQASLITEKIILENLVDEYIYPGYHTIVWDNPTISSGIYFINLISSDFNESHKVTLLK